MNTCEYPSRYARNIGLREIGTAGQEKLKNAKVFIVGCGALGSIAAMYLAGAGVGKIAISDFDTIDISNLQRQLSFSEDNLGEKKVTVLAERLHKLNSEIDIEVIDRLLTTRLLPEYIRDADFVLEGSDNPDTKHAVAKICTDLGKPYCIGGVDGFQGQVMTCLPGTPSYTEFFPTAAEAGGFTPCRLGGVLGPLPGIVGSIQAAEAIKYITNAGELLTGRMLMIDALTMQFSTIEF
jgi:adenylyltransferase/sulfurtransferase